MDIQGLPAGLAEPRGGNAGHNRPVSARAASVTNPKLDVAGPCVAEVCGAHPLGTTRRGNRRVPPR